MATAALKRTSFSKLFDEIGTVDQVGIEERVAKFTTRSIKKSSKVWGLKAAVSMVDPLVYRVGPRESNQHQRSDFCRKGASRSIGTGKIVVLLLPVATSTSVWR